ncbi:hypothetical protein KUH32_05570 [Thalassococcus sp. CAU 1522]|uniref:Membrane protein YjdF n=1 Tax=Thalassococcus arenae TaxID=2851652 RepID=A0ABS6N5D8_9RHOB|nr:hypothetical protein [Thalassococcus arenae]
MRRNYAVYAIWAFLTLELSVALVTGRWTTAFVAAATLGLSALPALFAARFDIRLPVSFFAAAVLFIFATIYLGEVGDFYERYWWWDIMLHGGSAMGFGLIGFLFVFMLFEGNRYAAPPIAVAFISFCFAVTIGAVWEIFEFGMDQLFGFNMQKSGLTDTMTDLIVNCAGAAVGAAAGYFYLKGRQLGGPIAAIEEFVRLNRRLFRKATRRD